MPETCAVAVAIALRWAGADYELEIRDPNRSDEPAYRAVNPHGQVPAMTLPGELVLTEAQALLLLVADSHPESELAPPSSQPMARFRLEELLAFMTGDVQRAFEPFRPQRMAACRPPPVDQSLALSRLCSLLDRLEGQLGTKPYALVRRSVADAYLYVLARWASGLGDVTTTFPNLMRFRSVMERDPDVAAALAAHAMRLLHRT